MSHPFSRTDTSLPLQVTMNPPLSKGATTGLAERRFVELLMRNSPVRGSPSALYSRANTLTLTFILPGCEFVEFSAEGIKNSEIHETTNCPDRKDAIAGSR